MMTGEGELPTVREYTAEKENSNLPLCDPTAVFYSSASISRQ